jgi:hypothetical protein
LQPNRELDFKLCRGKKRKESERETGGGHHAGSQHNREDPRFYTGKKEKGEIGVQVLESAAARESFVYRSFEDWGFL